MAEPKKLLSFEFISLNFVSFFAFCNMAVFYSFFSYLGQIDIARDWRGFLVGLEPMSAFVLRLAIIPLLHVGNAAKVMLLALVMLVVALWSYSRALTVPALIVLRIFHGAAFVLLVSASMALMVHLIPKERSAQGFGIVSITALIPYAVMPLVNEALLPVLKSEAHIYAAVTVLAAPAILLLLVLGKRIGKAVEGMDATLMQRPRREELRQNLRQPSILLVLGVNLMIYLCYSTVFYFMKSFVARMGSGDAGTFFATATVMMIAVRLLGGAVFDKADKIRTLGFFVALLLVCFVLFRFARTPLDLYLLAAFYGLCIGVILPLLNATMFHVSPPRLRGLNTNLALFMMDAGFFLSPYLGGLLLATGGSIDTLFTICWGFLAFSLVLLLILGQRKVTEPQQSLSPS